MSNPVIDFNNGNIIIPTAPNTGIDSNGDIHVQVGNNVSIDVNTGDVHVTSDWGNNNNNNNNDQW